MNPYFKKYTGWHVELTARCPLDCPGCNRQEVVAANQLKTDINFEYLKNLFPKATLPEIQYMYFCGNNGDPIYHPQFHDIAEYFFTVQHLDLTTNGMQNTNFWNRVLETWPENSTVQLSIDGLKDTNHLYRINSKWDKIQNLFDLISSKKRKCRIEWKYIVFDHNRHQVDEAIELSKKLGINMFRIKKSYPIPEDRTLNGKINPYNKTDLFPNNNTETINEISPFCSTGDMHYIDAWGNYWPCCWIDQEKASGYNTINIRDRTLEDLRIHYNSFSSCLQSWNTAPSSCKKFCAKILKNSNELKVPNSQVGRIDISND